MNTKLPSAPSPYDVLGVSPDADDERIRAAYLAKLKQYPPDRSPAEFEQVRDAYDLLRDRRRRTQHTLFSTDPDAPLESLLGDMDNEIQFAGPSLWLAVLKER
jgi:curved DNA-binding protein CbpA